jgi:hypothetical protein
MGLARERERLTGSSAMISFVYLLANDAAVNIILRVDVGHAVEREIQGTVPGKPATCGQGGNRHLVEPIGRGTWEPFKRSGLEDIEFSFVS